jgi:hypothetical protein
VEEEKKDKQTQIQEVLDSDIPIQTYLKSTHGLVLKQMLANI